MDNFYRPLTNRTREQAGDVVVSGEVQTFRHDRSAQDSQELAVHNLPQTRDRIIAEPGQVVSWAHFRVGLEEIYGISTVRY
ncbi:hypothetical protein [Streptomyces cylindrosporus]|uniref:Uncharacterized protein n=1 Tax=Streptomyces cylindrosporus TaxID=2927583 RepID=A0ABS9YNA4_9ACTN|nr:hypothetical protein [Streptomyces cylindrosporus]MCI3278625.1 hypothetical protein [Streptomyces cylindrosporus]